MRFPNAYIVRLGSWKDYVGGMTNEVCNSFATIKACRQLIEWHKRRPGYAYHSLETNDGQD